ncbi:hypothetical protein [Microbacterium sp. NPDC097977]|uniref:hypothetical protein n=1 Tax=Microbacterium sp. NPDC097977 TaxID=3155686 RepID=UPI003325B723
MTSLMLSGPFLGDERDHLCTLYGILPISRRVVVVGVLVIVIGTITAVRLYSTRELR